MTRRRWMLVVAACVLIAGGLWLAWAGGGAAHAVGGSSPAPAATEPDPTSLLAGDVSNPAAAREPVAAETTDDGYRVQVVSAAGEPVAGAAVFLGADAWRADANGTEALGAEAQSDGEGRARFEQARDDWHCLALIAPGHAPVWQQRAVTSGVETVTLPESVSVAGFVTVDGEVPSVPVGLELRGYLDPTDAWPEAARSWLRAKNDGVGALNGSSGAGGAFSFRGLAPGVSVRLLGPEGLRLRAGGEGTRAELSLVTPRVGVRLDLVTLPAIRGKVVSQSGTKKPFTATVRGLGGQPDIVSFYSPRTVTLSYTFHDARGGRRQGRLFHTVGSDFTIPFAEQDLIRFELDVFDGMVGWFGGRVLARREILGDLQRSHDLGEIDLDAGQRELIVTVRDRAGQPIEGAKVAAGGAVLDATNGRGDAYVTICPAMNVLTVGALGFRLARIPVPAAPQQRLEVTLERANMLRFIVVAAARAHCANLILRTDLPGPYHSDDPELVPDFASVRGPAPGGGIYSSTGAHSHLYNVPEDGILELRDLPVGVEFPLTLVDRFDHVHWQGRVELDAEEQREIRHVLSQPPRVVRARAVGAGGRALAGAQVQAGGWDFGREGDEDGWFVLEGVFGPSPATSVSAPGHVSRHLPAGHLDRDSVVLLEPARQVWVEIRDGDGKHVDADVQYRAPDGLAVGMAQSEPGLVRIDGVPLRAGELVVRPSGGEESRHPVGTSETRVRVTVGR